MRNVLIAALLMISSPTWAQQTPPSIQQLKTLELLEDFTDKIDTLMDATDAMTRERRSECLQAFGHEQFCGCLTETLPVAWNFAQYVSITTGTKEENGYAGLDEELKGAYDMVAPAREHCVGAMQRP